MDKPADSCVRESVILDSVFMMNISRPSSRSKSLPEGVLSLPNARELDMILETKIGPVVIEIKQRPALRDPEQMQKSAAQIFEEIVRVVKAGELVGLAKKGGMCDEPEKTELCI